MGSLEEREIQEAMVKLVLNQKKTNETLENKPSDLKIGINCIIEALRGRRVLSATETKIEFSVSSDAPGVDVYYGGDTTLFHHPKVVKIHIVCKGTFSLIIIFLIDNDL